MALSLWQFRLSSFEVTSSNFLLSSKERYLGKRLSSLGVSKSWAGFVSINFAFLLKYLKKIRMVETFLALVVALL